MRAIKFIQITIIGLFMFSNTAFAQWEEGNLNVSFALPPIALIDIEPSFNNSIYFTVVPSSESGASPQFSESSNESLWINYSSAMVHAATSRSIVAEISEGILPKGISLFLKASGYSGSGDGRLGQSTGKIPYRTNHKQLLQMLGIAFTGDGINNGHSLSFSIEISDFTMIYSDEESSFTILYTISDN